MVKKQRHMKDAWALFLAVYNSDKEGLKKVITRIWKVQSFYLSHCSRREGIMGKLEETSYAYTQSALDNSLERVLHDETTNFISNTKKEWRMFNHSPSAEYLPLPMIHTCDLEHSFNLQVPSFGTMLKSWIQDISLIMSSVYCMFSGASLLALFEPHHVHPFLVNNLTSFIISQRIRDQRKHVERKVFHAARIPYGFTS